jgi:hypothetical protein
MFPIGYRRQKIGAAMTVQCIADIIHEFTDFGYCWFFVPSGSLSSVTAGWLFPLDFLLSADKKQ